MSNCFKLLRLTILVIAALWFANCTVSPPKAYAAQPLVEIFVTTWCPYCKALEDYLQRKNVVYKRYNIEQSSEGKKKHSLLGGGGVPVVKIGTEVIRGFDPRAIDQALADQSRPSIFSPDAASKIGYQGVVIPP